MKVVSIFEEKKIQKFKIGTKTNFGESNFLEMFFKNLKTDCSIQKLNEHIFGLVFSHFCVLISQTDVDF